MPGRGDGVAKARTLLEKNMPGATVTDSRRGVGRRRGAEPRTPIPAGGGLRRDRAMTGVTRQRAYAFPRINPFPSR